jgi:hypothetical protein
MKYPRWAAWQLSVLAIGLSAQTIPARLEGGPGNDAFLDIH